MDMLEQIIINNGFESLEEFNHLVGTLHISSPSVMADFIKWRNEDGTKAGLLKLHGEDDLIR